MAGLVGQAKAQQAGELLPDLMTEAELAAEMKIKPKTLANQRSRRVGPPYIKLSGGIVRYSRRAVAAWMAANVVDHGGAVG